jgi:hypothetical protein
MSYQWQQDISGDWVNLTDVGRISGTNTSTLTITGTLTTDDATFRCWLNNGYLLDTYTDPVTLTVDLAPVIDSQPTSTEKIQGQDATFTTTAHGKPTVSYKWQYFSGSWNDLSDIGRISGSSTDTLTITGSLLADAGSYRCKVTNGVSPDAYTDTVILTVDLAPIIDSQPSDSTVIQGNDTSFITAAHGEPSVSYRWQIFSGSWNDLSDVGRISGSATDTLSITGALLADADSYRCHITNGISPDAYTDTVTLTVQLAPIIDSQPSDSEAVQGSNTHFITAAHGTPTVSYRWQVLSGTWTDLSDTGRISGSATDTLSITGTLLADTGSYRCHITNGVSPDAYTDTVTLTVDLAPIIDSQPSDSEVVQYSDASFITAAHGTPSVSYRWQVFSGGSWTSLSDAGRVSGSGTMTLTITGALLVDAGSYRCWITNGISPDAYTDTVTLTVDLAPIIDIQPFDSTVVQGSSASFTTAAHGIPTVSYQWQRFFGGSWIDLSDNVRISGSLTDAVTIISTLVSDTGLYRCKVTNGVSPDAYTDTVTLTVNLAPVIDDQPVDSTIVQGSIANFTVTAHGTPSVSYRWQVLSGTWTDLSDAGRISGSFTNTLTITGVILADVNSYRCHITNGISPDVNTNVVTLTVNTWPVIDLQPISMQKVQGETATFMTAAHGIPDVSYRWQLLSGVSWIDLSDTGRISGSGTATLTLTGVLAVDSGSYRCHIANGISPDAYTDTADLIMEIAIVTQPVPVTTYSQEVVSFNVVAEGFQPIAYQWKKNGIDIAGAILSEFVINRVILSDTGSYSVIISNDYGSVLSDVVLLTVLSVPVIVEQPADVGARVHDSISLHTTALGSGTLTYQWYRIDNAGNKTTFVDDVRTSGSTTNLLTISDVCEGDQGYYFCRVVNNLGSTVTALASVIVTKTSQVSDINSSRITEVDIEQGKKFWAGIIASYDYFNA